MKYLLAAALLLILVFLTLPVTPPPVGQAVNALSEVEGAQERYFQKHGRYLQVLADNKLPHYENGTVEEKLGKSIPSNYTVHIYETPKGEWGYQVFWDDETHIHAKGYGPEAAARTRSTPKSELTTGI